MNFLVYPVIHNDYLLCSFVFVVFLVIHLISSLFLYIFSYFLPKLPVLAAAPDTVFFGFFQYCSTYFYRKSLNFCICLLEYPILYTYIYYHYVSLYYTPPVLFHCYFYNNPIFHYTINFYYLSFS